MVNTVGRLQILASVLTTLSMSVAAASLPTGSLDTAKNATGAVKAAETQTPPIGWLKWKTFDKLYFGKLNGQKTTDEQRLAMLKTASQTLDGRLTAFTPDQLLRVINTMHTESAKLEALAELVTSTRYNNDDISTITRSFSSMKNDAHALLIAVGGYGGY